MRAYSSSLSPSSRHGCGWSGVWAAWATVSVTVRASSSVTGTSVNVAEDHPREPSVISGPPAGGTGRSAQSPAARHSVTSVTGQGAEEAGRVEGRAAGRADRRGAGAGGDRDQRGRRAGAGGAGGRGGRRGPGGGVGGLQTGAGAQTTTRRG